MEALAVEPLVSGSEWQLRLLVKEMNGILYSSHILQCWISGNFKHIFEDKPNESRVLCCLLSVIHPMK